MPRVQDKQDVYRARLGEETYAKAQEIRTWLRKQPLKSLIMAFLADATEKTP